ncbi:MAG: LAGLIDADG family homing endonuclease [Candidatus Woesebacteria bacterium]|nr:LAGLIDADG family homing endonuclease [Candidatus Woesebacteria bacterium]
MGRIRFKRGEQRAWVEEILEKSGLTTNGVAGLCGVSARTIRDWRREKFTIFEDSCKLLSQNFNVKIPKEVILLNDYWYGIKGAKKGGLQSLKLYGPPGTKEGRIKGGLISQQRRRDDPEKYRLLGCNVPKNFKILKKSEKLAEMVGIILGDGGITNCQLKITLDSETDKEFVKYVCKISKHIFGEEFSTYRRKTCRAVDLVLSGVNLVEKLSQLGLYQGDKIKRQIDFPSWIWWKNVYQRMCVRGLMDTDGCVYLHYHSSNGLKYRNIGICFTSRSKPLLLSFSKVLRLDKIKHSIHKDGERIYIYDLEQVKKYFKIFGSSNPKHLNKLKYHLLYNRRLN